MKTSKRLSKKEWKEIKKLLDNPDRNISQIARDYNVSRHTIYSMAWRYGWFEKKETIPLSFLQRFRNRFAKQCYFCKKNIYIVIHHKNLNNKDNYKDNLIPLCSSCHKRLHNILPNKQINKDNPQYSQTRRNNYKRGTTKSEIK